MGFAFWIAIALRALIAILDILSSKKSYSASEWAKLTELATRASQVRQACRTAGMVLPPE